MWYVATGTQNLKVTEDEGCIVWVKHVISKASGPNPMLLYAHYQAGRGVLLIKHRTYGQNVFTLILEVLPEMFVKVIYSTFATALVHGTKTSG